MTKTLIPTDEQLVEFFNENDWNYLSPETFIDIARSVLECWGRPAIAPIPVSERLPGPEDCDGEGRCWFSSRLNADGRWNLEDRTSGLNSRWYSHWLPFHALPLP